MSRSFHQRHRVSKKTKCPRAILGMYYKDGIKHLIYRKLKLKPYGRKNFIGYGEEEYLKAYGYYTCPHTNKTRERFLSKLYIRDELNEKSSEI